MTPKQAKALAYVRARLEAGALAPTFDEIGAHVRCSKSNAFRIVAALIAAGHLVRTADKTRALALPPAGGEAPVVVIRFTDHVGTGGGIEMYVFGGGPVRLLSIDEACPGDRVFEVLTRFPMAELAKLVPPGSPIGSKSDERHGALSHKLEAAGEGRRHLEVVR